MPGEPLDSFDIGYVNSSGVYALADRSNKAVDFFSAATGKFLGRATGFAGFNKADGADRAGPDGVVAVGNNEFYAGDADGVKVVDLRTRKVVASIPTGGQKRSDELTYDPRDQLVIAVNNADDPPFVSFISTRSRKVVGRLVLTHASDGAEQPVYDPHSGLVYLSIPTVDKVQANGAIAVIDPRTRALLKMLPVGKCMPAGLALGPDENLVVGCSDDGVAAGFPAHSLVMHAPTGKILADVPVGGSDEVWSDMRAGQYYLAAVANRGGPTLGVIDSHTNRLVAALPTGLRAHSVAVDAATGKIFVPIQANGAGDCSRGCIAVFGSK
ncbi:MAG: cytochrome C nitrite reductase [Gammaproteobacteria bacterium]|nr:cytochrome C nitrite reductase [Gammaproteobacteria bacterium]